MIMKVVMINDQVKHMVRTRAQEFIQFMPCLTFMDLLHAQSHAMPDVYGLVACPPCAHCDDSERENTPFLSSIDTGDDNAPWPIPSSLKATFIKSSPQQPKKNGLSYQSQKSRN